MSENDWKVQVFQDQRERTDRLMLKLIDCDLDGPGGDDPDFRLDTSHGWHTVLLTQEGIEKLADMALTQAARERA